MATKLAKYTLVDSPDLPQRAVHFGQDDHHPALGGSTCFGVDQLEEGGRQRQQRQRVQAGVGGSSLHLGTARIDELVAFDAPLQVQAEAAEAEAAEGEEGEAGEPAAAESSDSDESSEPEE